jgi:hypothetical protein
VLCPALLPRDISRDDEARPATGQELTVLFGDDLTMSFISMGDVDLLHPPKELEQRRHKLKRLVQSPNSFFMDVKCPGCFTINTVRMMMCMGVAVRASG